MKKILPLLLLVFIISCKKEASSPYSLPNAYSNQTTGASAKDLLSGTTYSTINIEIQYMPGYAPDAAAINNLSTFLNALCNKTGGVTISQMQLAANGSKLTVNDVSLIEKQNRTAYTKGTTLALYLLITDGQDTSSKILGVAYRNTSLCLFGKTIFDNSGGFGQVSRTVLESTVLEHEMGHILGLVNLGSPMQVNHADTAHLNHCNDQNCLMYYATESQAFGIFGTNIPQLDANCRNDLHANGGK